MVGQRVLLSAFALLATASWPLGVASGARVTSDLLFEYTFPRAECEAGRFADSASSALLGDLVRAAATTECTDGLGVVSADDGTADARVVSSGIAGPLNEALAASSMAGMTIELWMKPRSIGSDMNDDTPILTLGRSDEPDNSDCSDGWSLRVTQKKKKLALSFRFIYTEEGEDDANFGCTLFSSGNLLYDTGYRHVVFVVDGSDVRSFLRRSWRNRSSPPALVGFEAAAPPTDPRASGSHRHAKTPSSRNHAACD
jgi:hypothetical protein